MWRSKHRLLAVALAMMALLVAIAPASAGRAWCRSDPVLIINGDVVDIQASSSLEMYRTASGPIELVVTVPHGSRAHVILSDFGFGRGYDIKIQESGSLPRGVRANVAMRAPSSVDGLPVGLHGTRATVDLAGLLRLRPNILWVDQSTGVANEWITLDVR